MLFPSSKSFSDSPPSIIYSQNSPALTGCSHLFGFMSHASVTHSQCALLYNPCSFSFMLDFWPQPPPSGVPFTPDSAYLQHVLHLLQGPIQCQLSLQVFLFGSNFFLYRHSNSSFSVSLWWYCGFLHFIILIYTLYMCMCVTDDKKAPCK